MDRTMREIPTTWNDTTTLDVNPQSINEIRELTYEELRLVSGGSEDMDGGGGGGGGGGAC